MSRRPSRTTDQPGSSVHAPGRVTTTWQTIRNRILARIRSHEWQAGELIPTEKQLAAEWGCARATVNRALRDLADSGVVERRRKVGTRIAPEMTQGAGLKSSVIWNNIRALGAEYGYRLIHAEETGAGAAIAQILHLEPSSPVTHAAAAFLADGQPYCAEEVWLPIAGAPVVGAEQLASASAREWLDRTGRLTHGRSTIMTAAVTGPCAEALRLAAGTPVLTIERVEWAGATPLALMRQYFPPGHQLRYEG